MPESIYRQQITAVVLNGVPLQGFMDGSAVRMKPIGGEVQHTEGTDGPGINIATKQGYLVEVDLREESPNHEMIADINRNQATGGPGVSLVLFTGTRRIFSTAEAYVGQHGELSTGDKKQGGTTWTFITRQPDFY